MSHENTWRARVATTPVVVVKDAVNIVNGNELETGEHLKKVAQDVTEIPDRIGD